MEDFFKSPAYLKMCKLMAKINKRFEEKEKRERILKLESEMPKYTRYEQRRIEERRERCYKYAHMRIEIMRKNSESEDLTNFEEEVGTYKNLYVFNFRDADVHGSEFWDWIKSFRNDNSTKVYFGYNGSLTRKLLGEEEEEDEVIKPNRKKHKAHYKSTEFIMPDGEKLSVHYNSRLVTKKPNKSRELRPGLDKIASMFDGGADDVGLILTDSPEEVVLSKLREYSELKYLKPLDPAPSTLVFEKGEVLTLPPSSKAAKLFPKLQKLGMPVELNGSVLQLTEKFVVCEKRVLVKKNGAMILQLLERKMIPYFVKPVCHWIASTGEIHYYPSNVLNGGISAS